MTSFTARLWGKEYLKLLIISCSSFVWYFVVVFRLFHRRRLSIFLDNFLFKPNLQMHCCQMILFYGPWKKSAIWVALIWNIIYWFHMITGFKYWLNKIGNENVSLKQINYFYVCTSFVFSWLVTAVKFSKSLSRVQHFCLYYPTGKASIKTRKFGRKITVRMFGWIIGTSLVACNPFWEEHWKDVV